MNKLFTKIATLSVGLAMAIGIGVAVGSERKAVVVKAAPVEHTIVFSMSGFGGTATGYQNISKSGNGVIDEDEDDLLSASAYGFNQSTGQVRGNKTAIGGASITSSDNTKNWHLFNTAAIEGAIKSIQVVSSGTINSSNYFKDTLNVSLGTSTQGAVTTWDTENVPSNIATATAAKINSASYNNSYTFTDLNSSTNYSFFKICSLTAFTAGTVTGVTVTVVYEEVDEGEKTITYQDNGATSGEVPSATTIVDGAATVAGNTGSLAKSHYTFNGWNTKADPTAEGATHYAVGTNLTGLTKSMILYAEWVQSEFQVLYNKNGGTGTMSDSNWYASGGSATAKANTFTAPEGKVFDSWNTESDGTGVTYAAGATISNITATVTLYARWVKDPSLTEWKFLKRITSEPTSAGGKYVIGCQYDDTFYIMKSAVTSQIAATTYSLAWKDTYSGTDCYTLRADLTEYGWTLGGSSGAWTFTDASDNLLAYGSSTSFKVGTSGQNDTKWTITQPGTSSDAYGCGTFALTNVGTNTRGVIFQHATNTNPQTYRFGAYAKSNVKKAIQNNAYYRNLELYEVVSVSGITKLSITCDNGATAPSKTDWGTAASIFSGYANEIKSYYKHANFTVVNDVVTAREGTDSDVAAFVAKYDYIVAKYNKLLGDTDYNDFMSRNPSALGSGRIVLDGIISNNGATLIIVVASIVSLTAIGGYFLFKKKKQY